MMNRIKKWHFSFLVFLFFGLPPSKSWAACGLSLTANDIVVSWNLNFTAIAVSVLVSRSNSDACSYALTFTKGNATSYTTRRAEDGGKTIRYQIYKDSGLSKILKDNPDITSADEVVEGGFQAGPTPISQTVNYYFEIPFNLATTPSLVSNGTYADSFVINLYEDAAPPYATLIESKSVNVTVTVAQMIALSLVDPGNGFILGQLAKSANFTTLTEGATQSMDLRVRSNAGFDVTFSSGNNGRLKHLTKNSYVPYSLYVNGIALNLSNSSTVPVSGLTGSGSTGLSGLAYPIKVVIGSVTGAGVLAGAHADDVIITATTTE